MNKKSMVSKKIALMLAFIMMLSTMQVTALAEYAPEYVPEIVNEIIAFDYLTGDVAAQTVPFGTDASILNLPTTIGATINYGLTTLSTVAAITVENVTWESHPPFNPFAVGTYTFTAVLYEAYKLAQDVELPVITVNVLPLNITPTATNTLPTGLVFLAPIERDIPAGATAINNEAELRAIPNNANGFFYLTDDINLTSAWTPITNFSGTFDGQGFSINNFYAPQTLTSNNFGLFANVSGSATIKNLGLNISDGGLNISANSTARLNVGGFVGTLADGAAPRRLTIHNSFVTGDMHVTNVSGSTNLGGFVGTIAIAPSALHISDSYTTGNISAYAGVASGNGTVVNAGGLVGYTMGHFIIERSYTLGDISAILTTPVIASWQTITAGGLLGHVSSGTAAGAYELYRTYVAGNISASTQVSGTIFGGDLIGSMENRALLIVEHSFHNSTQQIMVPTLRDLVLGQPAQHFSLEDLLGERAYISVNVNDITRVPNINVSGHLVRGHGVDAAYVSVYLNNSFLTTVNADNNGAFATTINLYRLGYHHITVVATVGDRRISRTMVVEFNDGLFVDVKEFWANSFYPPTNLIRNDGRLDILIYATRRPIAFEVLLDVHSEVTVTEVNLLTCNGLVFSMAYANQNRWVYTDVNPLVSSYLSGKISLEIIWKATQGHDTNAMITNIIDGVTIDPARFRNSLLMPNDDVGPGVTTNAYILRPNQEPNRGTLTPNSPSQEVAPGLFIHPRGGNQRWVLEATAQAVGNTFVFWAHANGLSEVIFATINEVGSYYIGNIRGMNAFYFYGYIAGYTTMRDITYGRYRLLIDPSGYVYEAVLSNRLEGVTATIFEYGRSQPWDAAPSMQDNPLITNAIGYYAWDVPAGTWRVRYEKDGFETAYSIWMPVPPEHTEVHIGLINLSKPYVRRVTGFPTGIEVVFSKFMDSNSIDESITVMANGVPVEGEIVLINRESNFLKLDYLHGEIQGAYPNGGFPNARVNSREFASILRFVPAQTLSGSVQVTIGGNVKCYADVPMGNDDVRTIQIVQEPTEITVTNAHINFGQQGSITVNVGPQGAVEGRTITAVSDSTIAYVQTPNVVVDSTGTATINIKGLLPGMATITIKLDDTLLTAQSAAVIAPPQDIRIADMWYVYGNNPYMISLISEMLGITAHAPVITSASNYDAVSGIFSNFQVTATGTPLPLFHLEAAPTGVTINPVSGLISIAGATEIGVHEFSVVASNSNDSTSQNFVLNVAYINDDDNNENGNGSGDSGNNNENNGNGGNDNDNGGGNNDSGNENNNQTVGSYYSTPYTAPNLRPGVSFQNGNRVFILNSGNPLVITVRKDFSMFKGLNLGDLELIDGLDFSAASGGSTIITLYPSFLDGLTVGWHVITALFADDTIVNIRFNVVAPIAEEAESDPAPMPDLSFMLTHPIQPNPFTDVTPSEWYSDAIAFVYANRLMTGTSTNPMAFSPNASLTRAMAVTVLYRHAGNPTTNANIHFNDVENGTWYTSAIQWAAENGIVQGFGDGNFGPSKAITRQDMTVLLSRYTEFKTTELPTMPIQVGFVDHADIAKYATRAEFAVILMDLFS